ncbi:sensor histidine kinase [Paenibacillus sp. NPDC058071]|uniref:sensor histidine kinase n=1 Tax=Paenibacillus sp. NPDC058071 TaxID=3346326 RepID=UPI0036D763E8
MRGNIALRIIARNMMHFVLSGILAIISVYFLIWLADTLTSGYNDLRYWVYRLLSVTGREIPVVTIGILLFVVYFCIFQWRYYRYAGQMSRSIHHISEGHFNETIAVQAQHPLGHIARDTNMLIDKLKNSLEDERRAEQTKNELITNVSHDLRTPLTSVLGYLGLIVQDRYRDEVELRHYVQIAYEKSQRLHVLIQDLFEYTRMRHDAIPLKMVQFSLNEMLGQLLVQFHPQLEQSQMEASFTSKEKDLAVTGDPAKLVRVFENLLSNAITYGHEGRRVDIRLWRERDAAVVEIVNYGEPISAVDLPYLFDRFYRIDKSRTAEKTSGGSGLGLAIAKSIVERHRGTIIAASDSQSTSFTVRLPMTLPEPRSNELTGNGNGNGNGNGTDAGVGVGINEKMS